MRLLGYVFRRPCSNQASTSQGVLKIGSVKMDVKTTRRSELVPAGFASPNVPSEMLSHLKWLLQKDILRQDVFLLGTPGMLRSHVVLQYLELCNREYEYLSVTRDTTEADIKQRREISSGSAYYTDLCAVRAALEGRILVIDGVERAERNVLPILNNLLENREMQLDDGRFLMKHDGYDKLLERYSPEELKKMGVERVSDRFHVIALGLPVPRYPGHSLDPPLRSRFQCRNIPSLSFEATSSLFKALAPNVRTDEANNLVSLAFALNSQDQLSLPTFPTDNLQKGARIWNSNSSFNSGEIFRMLYPLETILKENEQNVVRDFLKKFSVDDMANHKVAGTIVNVKLDKNAAAVDISYNSKESSFRAPRGSSDVLRDPEYVSTPQHDRLLAELAVSHAHGDFALLGPKGSGKTILVEQFAKMFSYATETMIMYQDMNSRELLQRRRMLSNGDTVWEDSQLVQSAKSSALCVLDGIDRVHWSALEVVAPLVHHRHLHLPDGSRLVSEVEFKALGSKSGMTAEQLNESGIWSIPDSFRLILTGDSECGEHPWLNEPILGLLPFHTLNPLPVDEQVRIMTAAVPDVNQTTTRALVDCVEALRSSHDAGLRGVALSLSLRKLIHILRRDTLHSGELRSLVEKAALARFLPSITKTAFATALDKANIRDAAKDPGDWKADIQLLRQESKLGEESMIPNVVFYENVQHMAVMRDMARDFVLGSHLLLIGNQGVGKNKITDRFLHLINRPRQYMQLHRDTTVESLTIQTTVEDGVLKHEDSALVKAVRNGQVLVVDEADKAPLHVIAVLKSLLDSGTLLLGDGRRIQPAHFPQSDRTIQLHPEFRMIMLANRPGFPFLGNDLFGVLGDLFSVHTVDNPSRDSEIAMLKQYAPDVPEEHMQKLVSAFSELRDMADSGLLQYPYSTRELVNIVKHANEFPKDPLATVVRNVFDFDQYNEETVKSIEEVFQKHGIPLGVENLKDRVFLAQRFNIPPLKTIGSWGVQDNVIPHKPDHNRMDIRFENSFSYDRCNQLPLRKEHMRSGQFTEQDCAWQIPMPDVTICSDALMMNGSLTIAAVNPLTIYHVDYLEQDNNALEIDLSELIKRPRGQFEPRLRLAEYKNSVLIHEETTNTMMLMDPRKRTVSVVNTDSSLLDAFGKLLKTDTSGWRMVPGKTPLVYERNGSGVILLEDSSIVKLSLPNNVSHVVPCANDRWIVYWKDDSPAGLLCLENGVPMIRPLEGDIQNGVKLNGMRVIPGKDASMMTADGYYCLQTNGFPHTMMSSELLASERKVPEKEDDFVDHRRPYYVAESVKTMDRNRNMVVLEGGILVSPKAKWETPGYAMPKDQASSHVGGFLEAVDPTSGFVQYVPVPIPHYHNFHQKWVHTISKTPFIVCPWTDTKLITVDTSGGIRSYEVSSSTIARSYREWQGMLGEDEGRLRMEFDRNFEDFDASKLDEPKLGKFDPENTPHVGGNQWMGGTGGYNTAGLGGVGGPFRLDAGHDVHQMPDMAKQQVPESIKEKAREIARAEYAKKLKEIQMSEYDDEAYQKLWRKVNNESGHLRSIIEQLEAKKKERQWARHQTSGDLDDGKLIEGMTGEKNIYRRRMDKLPEPGTPQVKPKRLRLCFDVSGSMYRFNGYDKRLQRSLEASLMVMTALEGKDAKVKYDLIGHSGDGPCTIFVKDKYPTNNKQRLEILKQMLAHTQFCASGDYTVEALDFSVKQLAKEEDVDERIVVLISDANLDRYGIRPKDIVSAMNKDSSVNCFVIFIGSLGEQAAKLQRALPAGKAFVCTDTSELPTIMQSIFASTLI